VTGSTLAKSSRRPLLLLLLLFAAPLGGAFLLYYGSGWRPASHTNHGQLIVPVVPAANGPASVIDCTSGFHSCHVLVSDQIFHAAWGLAVVSTERSLFAKPRLPLWLRAA